MPSAASLPPPLFRPSSFLVSSLSKTLALLPCSRYALKLLGSSSSSPSSSPSSYCFCSHFSLRPFIEHPSPKLIRRAITSPLSTAAAAAVEADFDLSSADSTSTSASASPTPKTIMPKKKARREAPESLLRHQLDMCSKNGDLMEALRLYEAARIAGTSLSLHHFNVLLYLCSSAADPAGLEHGFEIYRQMALEGVAPNESTFTSLARLAAAKEDPDLAFDLVKQMSAAGIPPKLRSFGPTLFGFCKKGDAVKAHEVEEYMASANVQPEESELAALLQLNAEQGRGNDVYRILHRMRVIVRRVSVATAEIVDRWFGSSAASEVGLKEWDAGKVKEGIVKGGGGWHGQGWLGKGPWSVGRSQLDESGLCRRCGERLVCIDIDPVETNDFAKSLAALACQREARAGFTSFKEWLNRNGPFDAVIDGANVGLNNKRSFNFSQLNAVVNGIRQMSPSRKLPLVILHCARVKGGPADNPKIRKLLEDWRRAGALYATPPGSNDDWYWLYAAVSSKCLLVTNDEMRDHLFELLGTSFFPRWKEKHQARYSFSKTGLNFHLPPPYSIVIQESESGNWHIPTTSGDDIETPRQWVCATRQIASEL